MKIYTVTRVSTVDCYKRSGTDIEVVGTYGDQNTAYSAAAGKMHSLLNDYEAFENGTTSEEYKVFMEDTPDSQSHYEYLCQLGESTFVAQYVEDLIEEVLVEESTLES